MGQTTVTIRMDSELKQQFDSLCNDFGMSVNTAFNIFVRSVVRTKSIPFKIEGILKNKETILSKSRDAFEKLRILAETTGVTDLSLEEINEEIRLARKL